MTKQQIKVFGRARWKENTWQVSKHTTEIDKRNVHHIFLNIKVSNLKGNPVQKKKVHKKWKHNSLRVPHNQENPEIL